MRILLILLAAFPLCAFAQDLPAPEIQVDSIDLPTPQPIFIQPDFDVGSEAAFVYDLTTNEVVYNKNSTQQMAIASITKMMTSYVVLQSKVDLDESITITQFDVTFARKANRPSRLRPGMRFTRERLLNLALMYSENVAAIALGRTTFPGGVPEFVTHMNETAYVLEMTNTQFQDPIGIGTGNLSTASDLAKLVAAASNEQVIRDFSTTKFLPVDLPTKRRGKPTIYTNTNALVGFTDWNILMQKTGFTNAAGHCVVMVIDIQGHEYALIELNAPNNQQRAFDAIKLRHWVEEGTELTSNEVKTISPYKGVVHNKVAHPRHRRRHNA